MYGTISKFAGTKYRVVTCSIGGRYDPLTSTRRLDEVREVWSDHRNVVLDLEKGYLTDHDEGYWIAHLEHWIDLRYYDALYIPPREDTHYEHQMLSRIGHALARSRAVDVFEYRTISATPEWRPNLFVEIDYPAKVEALKKFSSQQGKPYFSEPVLNALHSDVTSLKRGIEKVEMYKVVSCYV